MSQEIIWNPKSWAGMNLIMNRNIVCLLHNDARMLPFILGSLSAGLTLINLFKLFIKPFHNSMFRIPKANLQGIFQIIFFFGERETSIK